MKFVRPLALVALLSAVWSLPARAQDEPVPVHELRAGILTGLRVDGARAFADHRVLVELGAVWGPTLNVLVEPSVSLRLLGPPNIALWVRAGYLWQHLSFTCHEIKVDDAQAVDISAALRLRLFGWLMAAEVGWEGLHRKGYVYCSDGGLEGDSTGIRAMVLSQWNIGRQLGVFVRGGLRTADHLPEIHMLPELHLGLSYGW